MVVAGLRLLLLIAIRQLKLALQRAIEAVFDVIVRAARQELCNLAPFVSVLLVRLNNCSVLLGSPLVLFDVRVQVVVPSLAALLTDTTGQRLRDVRPVLGAKPVHILGQLLVLLGAPGTLHHGRIEHLLPAMQALDVCALIKERRNLLPVLGSELVHKLREPLVLLVVPVALVVVRVGTRRRRPIHRIRRLHLIGFDVGQRVRWLQPAAGLFFSLA